MRKLFKDYEVRGDLLSQICSLNYSNYRNILKTAVAFSLSLNILSFNCLYSYFLISSCASV